MKKLFIALLLIVMNVSAAFANSSIIIENSNQKDVLNRLMKLLIKQGSTLENISDYSFTAYNVDTNFFWYLWYGSHTETRFMFSAIQDNKNVILSLGMKNTTRAGNATSDSFYSYKFQEQAMLQIIKKALKGYYSYGFEGQKTRKGIKITKLYYENTDTLQKLDFYDIITKINNQPVKGMSEQDIDIKLTPTKSNQSINITTVNKNKEQKNITLYSTFIKPAI